MMISHDDHFYPALFSALEQTHDDHFYPALFSALKQTHDDLS